MANIAVNIMSQVVRLVRGILGTMMIVGVFLNLVNVIGRYVFLKPIIWAEEILTYGLVWVVMLGATLVTWRANHLKMDAIYDLMPQTLKRVINVLVNLSIIACGVFVVSQSLHIRQLSEPGGPEERRRGDSHDLRSWGGPGGFHPGHPGGVDQVP